MGDPRVPSTFWAGLPANVANMKGVHVASPTPPKRGKTLADLSAASEAKRYTTLEKAADSAVKRVFAAAIAKEESMAKLVQAAVRNNIDDITRNLGIDDAVRRMNDDVGASLKRLKNAAAHTAAHMGAAVDSKLDDSVKRMEVEYQKVLDQIRADHGLTVRVEKWDGTTTTTGKVHKLMPDLLLHVSLRMDTVLVGPSGSGKTQAAKQVAEALDMPFYFEACSRYDLPSKWFGYMNAAGEYVETPVYRWYVGGGVMLIDEFDNMPGTIGVNLNAMLGNNMGSFPVGRVERHPDAICIAAGNTVGRGATSTYRSREGLDESTLERFAFMEWGYDEKLEASFSRRQWWVDLVQAIRKNVIASKMVYTVTPRAIINGDKLLTSGVSVDDTMARVVTKGWPIDDVLTALRGITHLLEEAKVAHALESKGRAA